MTLLAPPEAPQRLSVPAGSSFELPPAPPTSLDEAMLVDDSEAVEVVQSSNTMDLTEATIVDDSEAVEIVQSSNMMDLTEDDAPAASDLDEDSKIVNFCAITDCDTDSARGYLEVQYSITISVSETNL